MTEDEVKELLEKIVELASFLGWKSVLIQNSQGELLGMNLGSEEFINYKEGKSLHKEIH